MTDLLTRGDNISPPIDTTGERRASREPSPAAPRLRPTARTHAPLLAGILGFAVSAIGIGIPSVWYDEAATITSATRSWPQLFAEVQHVDAVHAVYYAFMHLVFTVFGYSPLTLRLPSAIAVGATAALIVVLLRRLGHPRLGLIAATVFCFIPRVTWTGGEGRSYAFSALFAVLLTLVLVRALHSADRRWWLFYAACVVLSCLVFVYLILIVVAHGSTMVVHLVRSRRAARASAVHWVLAVGTAGLLLLPFVLLLHGQQSQLQWIAPIGPQTAHQIIVTQWFRGADWMPAVGWLLLVAGGVILGRRACAHPTSTPTLAGLILPAVVLPTVGLLLVSSAYLPVYSPRYLAMCTPFVAIAMAAGIEALRIRPLMIAAVVLIATLALPNLAHTQRSPEAKEHSSWSQVAALIAQQRATRGGASTTAIVYGPLRHHPSATTRTIEYSYPRAFAGTIDVTLRTPAAQTGELWATQGALADSLDRLDDADTSYLITSVTRDARPATDATLGAIGWHPVARWGFTDIRVVEYVRG